MVALFLPVAAAASERVYFMVLRVRCASLHCYAVRRVAPLQGFSYRRRFSCFLQYATKAAPAFLGGFPLAASALAKAIQSDRRTWLSLPFSRATSRALSSAHSGSLISGASAVEADRGRKITRSSAVSSIL